MHFCLFFPIDSSVGDTGLSDFGLAMSAKYKDPSARLASAVCWSQLETAFRTAFGIRLTEEDIAFGDRGKPTLPHYPYYFSLSHSHGMGAVAIGDTPIGVDIEATVSSEQVKRLTGKVLSDREQAALANAASDAETCSLFTDYWTSKEAYFKMTGEGIYPETMRNWSLPADCEIIVQRLKGYSLTIIRKQNKGTAD